MTNKIGYHKGGGYEEIGVVSCSGENVVCIHILNSSPCQKTMALLNAEELKKLKELLNEI